MSLSDQRPAATSTGVIGESSSTGPPAQAAQSTSSKLELVQLATLAGLDLDTQALLLLVDLLLLGAPVKDVRSLLRSEAAKRAQQQIAPQ